MPTVGIDIQKKKHYKNSSIISHSYVPS